MDAGLVAVLAVLGGFLLVPLAFARVSTNPRRWSRVEGVLGRDSRGDVRWAPWFWIGMGAIYLGLRSGRPSDLGWLMEGQGLLYVAVGVAVFFLRRRLRRERSALQTQVQHRPEPGRPRTGG